MRRAFIFLLLVTINTIGQAPALAQQIPFLSELLSRYEEFNRLYTEKRRARQNISAVEAVRKRAEEAFKRGDVPGLLQTISEGRALLAGKKWDDREKFIASLTLETDRLVVEPNQVIQVSLTRMFPVAIDKAFTASPTVTFAIAPGEPAARPANAQLTPARLSTSSTLDSAQQPMVISGRLNIGETSSNAARKLLLPDGPYQVVARIESGSQVVAEITRTLYAIGCSCAMAD